MRQPGAPVPLYEYACRRRNYGPPTVFIQAMKRFLLVLLTGGILVAGVRVNIAIGSGHPIRRPRTVIVQRAPIVLGPRVTYAPPVIWAPAVVKLPARARLGWQDTEVIRRADDWVDFAMPVRASGEALFLRTSSRAQVDFAEVHFANGQVQVVDFNEANMQPGTFRLMDFPNSRHVESVRIVARARAPQTAFTLLMRK